MSPPISPQPSETRPRAGTAMSFSSQRSRRSNSSTGKIDLTETSRDKKRLNTKADPSKAITEATPVEQAQEASTVDDLRKMLHKDNEGNVITDPDRSNPTRHRLERPLDTIRAFNAAAEGTTSRRTSMNSRPGSQVGWNGDMNRRTSYYSNNGYSPQRPRMSPAGGYYRNSSYGFGPQSAVEESPGSSQMFARPPMRQQTYPYPGSHQNGNPNGHQNGYHNGESPVSYHSYHQSYETMTSGSEEYGKSTNPSSQNSSFDQLHQLRTKPEDFTPENPYANEIKFNQVSPTKPLTSYGFGEDHYGQEMAPPAVPSKGFALPAPNNPRQPIPLNSSPTDMTSPTNATSTKKQSWIKRRFSRRDH
ncbi:hypothetical protein AYO21_04796 [Fonsecaea monophora]|uniref:Uncharacterized protein n=2 Tax=Fonsecaea TaxID=40354 RepID=A0A0D2E0E0_9EURO|nr:uncharacterized protein Z517_02721 [Fonsecaea pedrosoi CBS 271.37]XP_022512906.1 hypothetical protein AYO21_04796 [Fonsecaea monophora]KIW83476.1 hypothetical protein Z517_02721 [Fonsecaea pedrosoi CBS 271.37]OAG40954.1 hypothetical protein AYO21_04796 [Fonsecaea monophora]